MRSLSKSGTPAPRGGTAISSIRRIMLLRGTVAIGRAICHEADHAGGRPPLFGKIKFEPLASALHQGPHGHPVTERCSTYIDAGQPASDRVVLVSPAFLSRRHRASPARWRNWRRNPCAGCLRVAPKGHKNPQVRHFEPNGVQYRTCGASAAVAISGVPCWLVNQQRWSSRQGRTGAGVGAERRASQEGGTLERHPARPKRHAPLTTLISSAVASHP